MNRGYVRGAIALALLCGAGSLAVASAQDTGIAYRAHIDGVPDTGLRSLLNQVSALMNRTDRRPVSRVALERRAQEDEKALEQVLDSEGYYAGTVHVRLDETADPVDAAIEVDLGTRFTVDRFDVRYTSEGDAPGEEILRRTNNPDIPLGQPARAADVLTAEQKLILTLQQNGYPLAKIADQSYAVDVVHHTMQVQIAIDHGRRWRFGTIHLVGADNVDPGFVLRKAPFKEGQTFDTKQLSD